MARLALDLNAEGNVPDRAKAAREVTRQASLQAQKVYQSLEVATHRPAVSEEFQKGGGRASPLSPYVLTHTFNFYEAAAA